MKSFKLRTALKRKKFGTVYVLLQHQDPVVQNVTKLLTNVTLTFLSWNMAHTLIFLLKSPMFANAINVFENTLATTVNEFVVNKLVKQTML